MTKLEFRRLNALASKFIREGSRDIRKSKRMFNKAGRSAQEGGSGDEGWRECLELGAGGYSSLSAGFELRRLLEKLKGQE